MILEVFSKDSERILLGFWEASGGIWKDADDSGRILKEFSKDSERIIMGGLWRNQEGFWGYWKDPKRILEGFCKDSGRLLGESGRILEIGTILEAFRKELEGF